MKHTEHNTILVTGGAGFIGSNFVRYIYSKYPTYNIIVLDLLTYAGNLDNFSVGMRNDPRFSFWYGDVRNSDLVGELVSKAAVVVHFAAESHVTRSIFDNRIFFETDVIGSQAVANAVLKHKHSVSVFVHISSSEVYGTALTVPMTEEHPLNPLSPYASAKAGADRLIYSYYKTYDIPVVILRPFNNYGPNQHLEKVIPRFISSCLLREPLTVHGDGQSERDWVYVNDLCSAIDLTIHHNDINRIKGEVFNISTGQSQNILSIADMVMERIGTQKSSIIHVGDRPGQVKKHIASFSKAKQLLHWEPTVNFRDGLNQTIDWYCSNRAWWEKLLWMRRVPIITANGKVEYH
jgi:dTDP-glucose 4,6-dehydratase